MHGSGLALLPPELVAHVSSADGAVTFPAAAGWRLGSGSVARVGSAA